MIPDSAILEAFRSALSEAERFRGATSPNPPVGAAALDLSGKVLAVAAHEKAGTPHAEARLIASLRDSGILASARTLVVTLEPCNHHGRTPPCTEAVISSGIREVVYGAPDPNPQVAGGGAAALASRGLGVRTLGELAGAEALAGRCWALIAPFAKWSTTGLPWITIKRAFSRDCSMVPPQGQKTFTSPRSLRLAHELRKRADAILTGSGTILADSPLFTVRHVPDHPEKKRFLIVLDRRSRVPESWLEAARARGFKPYRMGTPEEAFKFLGKNECLEVLVEAGPTLSEFIMQCGFWDESVVINQTGKPGDEDRVETRFR